MRVPLARRAPVVIFEAWKIIHVGSAITGGNEVPTEIDGTYKLMDG